MSEIWVVEHGEGRTSEWPSKEEAIRAAKRSDPVYRKEPTAFPRILYRFDRTTKLVRNEKEMQACLSENDKEKKRIWGMSPIDFGVETCPGATPEEVRDDRW